MSSRLPVDHTKRRSHTIRVGNRNAAVLAGESLDDWDDEELSRGQKRSRRGTWEGRPPKVVSKRLHDELVRRQMSKAHALMRDNLVGAVEVLNSLATGEDVEDAVRLKAISMIMDRVMGKAPDKVEVSVQKTPFEASLGSVIVRRDAGRDVIDVKPKEE